MGKLYKALFVLLIMLMVSRRGEGTLRENFYGSRCPNLESIIQKVVETKMKQAFATIPATVRLFFHDCFVKGCDASVLIQSPNFDADKDASDNLSLAGDGFDTVIKAKQEVEAQCPGIVSCADVLAIAARDAVVLAGGPAFDIELGRRDGLISRASRVPGHLPRPDFNLVQLNTMFARRNLSQTDMIALSGSHTLGFSHCNSFANRIYSFSPSNAVDPTMNQSLAKQLMTNCPKGVEPYIVVSMDHATPLTFDNVYFNNLVHGKGLFTSDQILFTDPASRPTVVDFANNPDHFYQAFITAMRKLGRFGVKTGSQGEIRRDCTAFNS